MALKDGFGQFIAARGREYQKYVEARLEEDCRETSVLREIVAAIQKLPPEQQVKVYAVAVTIDSVVDDFGDVGRIALALVGNAKIVELEDEEAKTSE